MTIKHIGAIIALLIILAIVVAVAEAEEPTTNVCVFEVTEPYTFIEFTWVRGQEAETTERWYYEVTATARFQYPSDADWITIVVNANATECTRVLEAEDNQDEGYTDGRVNPQSGDSFFAVYVVEGYLDVYSTITGQGILILHTNTAACSADGTACFSGDTLTLVDPEGKTYEIPVTLE